MNDEYEEFDPIGSDDEESDDGTIHAWQCYDEAKETELAGELPERKRKRPDKDAEAIRLWKLYLDTGKTFKKIAEEEGLAESTAKKKCYRGFELDTGFPATSVNRKKYREKLKQQKSPPTNLPCDECPDQKPGCSRDCKKLRECLPDMVQDQADFERSMIMPSNRDPGDLVDPRPDQPTKPVRVYDQEKEDN